MMLRMWACLWLAVAIWVVSPRLQAEQVAGFLNGLPLHQAATAKIACTTSSTFGSYHFCFVWYQQW